MKKIYAGIGARATPEHVMKKMTSIASELEALGFILRSGGADGADKAFADGVKDKKHKEIYLPWRGFNAIDSKFDTPSEKALEIAERFHPAWNKLSDGGKKLQGRNSHILLGESCQSTASFVICWTENGRAVGGTGQGLRIASTYGIRIYNLFNAKDEQDLMSFISMMKFMDVDIK